MRPTTHLLTTILAAASALLSTSPTLAHGLPTQTSQGAGMLTFTASTQLSMPDDGSIWFGGAVRIKSAGDHQVIIQAFGGGGGTVNSVNYDEWIELDTNQVGTMVSGRNVAAGLVNGLWTRSAGRDEWTSPAAGTHTASAHATLWTGGINVGAAHGHSFEAR